MNNIVLIGMMGSGKSTLSHLLYEKTGYDIVDCDQHIEDEQEMAISEIFEKYGESYFRDLEKSFLQELICHNTIISTGGGMVLSEENRLRMKEIGCVFYLSGSVECLYERLMDAVEHRPLLQGKQLKEQLQSLLNSREALYLDSADYVIGIDGKTPQEVISEIYAILRDLDYKFFI